MEKDPKSTLPPALLLLFSLVLLLLNSGCATSALWSEGFMTFHEPYPPNELALFDAADKGDVLVAYNELPPRSDRPKRRAYYLMENDARIRAGGKPRFVRLGATNGLSAMPLCGDAAASEALKQASVCARTNAGNRFVIVRNGQPSQQSFMLPTYPCWTSKARRVAWTPATLVLDATIAGGFIYLWAERHSGGAVTRSLAN